MTLPSFDGPQVRVDDAASSSPSTIQIASVGDGGFVIGLAGFAPSADDPDGGRSASFRLYGADRSPDGDAVVAPADLTERDELRFLISTPDGGFALIYLSELLSPPNFGPQGRAANILRFDQNGVQIGAEATVAVPDFGNVVGFAAFDDGRLGVAISDFNDVALSVVDATGAITTDAVSTGFAVNSIGPRNLMVQGDAGEIVLLTRAPGQVSGADVSLVGLDADGNETFSTLIFDEDDSGGTFGLARLSDGAFAVIAYSAASLRFVKVAADGTAGAVVDLGQVGDPGGSLADVVGDPDGGFTVLLSAFDSNAARSDGLGVKIDAAGALVGQFDLQRDLTGGQQSHVGTHIDDGDLIVGFINFTPEFRSSAEIQGFDPDGDTAGAAPTDIDLASAGAVARDAVAAVLGELSATDADAGDTFVFDLDPADSNGRFFTVDGATLRFADGISSNAVPNVEEVSVRVTDSFFNTFTETLTLPLEATGGGTPPPTPPSPVIFRGTGANEKRNGKATDDVLLGRSGKDVLNGRGGDDRIEGGKGADRLNGGAGNDLVEGGRGKDVLIGGKGRDDFFLGRKDGFDRILDFEVNRDDLVFTGGVKRLKDLEFKQRGDDLLVEAGRVKILLEDVDRADFDRGDVIFA